LTWKSAVINTEKLSHDEVEMDGCPAWTTRVQYRLDRSRRGDVARPMRPSAAALCLRLTRPRRRRRIGGNIAMNAGSKKGRAVARRWTTWRAGAW
jgi:hypothetical protein